MATHNDAEWTSRDKNIVPALASSVDERIVAETGFSSVLKKLDEVETGLKSLGGQVA